MGSSLTHKVVERIRVVQERVFSSSIHRVLGEVSSGLQVPFVEQGGGDHEAFLAVPNRLIGNQPVNDTVTWMGPSERRLTLLKNKALTAASGELQSTRGSYLFHRPCYSKKEK